MKFRWLRGVVPLVAVCLFAGACGANSDDGKGSSSSASSSALKSKAEADIKPQLTRPEKIGITQPLAEHPPANKTLVAIQCLTPSCATHVNEVKSIAQKLGWTVRVVTTGTESPEDVKKAWGKAVDLKPDGVFSYGSDRRYFNPELTELEKLGIPVLRMNTVDKTGSGLTGIILGRQNYIDVGNRAAEFLMSKSGDRVNVLNVNLGDVIPTLSKVGTGLDQTLKANCSKCKVYNLTVPISSIGGDLTQRITAYLRRNPQINYMVAGLAEMVVGLPAALDSAGFDKSKLGIVTIGTPDEAVVKYLSNGNYVQGIVSGGSVEQDWNAMDFFIRYFNKEDYQIPLKDETYPRWIITKGAVPEGQVSFPLVADYKQQYEQLWGIS